MKHSLERAGKIPVEGGEIGYRLYVPHNKEAAARTPLIVIHGGPGQSHAVLYDTLNGFADERPVIFYDQLGSHFSPAAMTPHLMRTERFADEIGHIMDVLGLKKAALLGYSWGGAIATEFALKNPDKTEALVLYSPLLSTPRWMKDCNALLEKISPAMRNIALRCEGEGKTSSPEYAAVEDAFGAQHYCRAKTLPESVAAHKAKRNKLVHDFMWGVCEFSAAGSLKDLDYYPRLPEIAAPTLLICGEHDPATPQAMNEARKLMQDAALRVLPGCSHSAHLENNAGLIGAVSRFLISRCKNPGISRPANPPRPPGP